MSYKCELCTEVVRQGVARRTYCHKRPDGNTEHEYPVCGNCHFLLGLGVSLADVVKRRRPKDPLAPIVVERVAATTVATPRPTPKVVVSTVDRWRRKANSDLAVQTPKRPEK